MFHSLTKIQTKQLKKNHPLTLSTVREKDYAKFAPCLQPPTINHEQHWQFNNDQKHKLTIPLHLSSSITTLDKEKKKSTRHKIGVIVNIGRHLWWPQVIHSQKAKWPKSREFRQTHWVNQHPTTLSTTSSNNHNSENNHNSISMITMKWSQKRRIPGADCSIRQDKEIRRVPIGGNMFGRRLRNLMSVGAGGCGRYCLF